MAEITLADPALIDERLSDLAERMPWQSQRRHRLRARRGVRGGRLLRRRPNALSLAYGLLENIAGELADAHKPPVAQS